MCSKTQLGYPRNAVAHLGGCLAGTPARLSNARHGDGARGPAKRLFLRSALRRSLGRFENANSVLSAVPRGAVASSSAVILCYLLV